MDFSIIAILTTFLFRLSSVLSPCVLPVVPIIITGTEKDSKYRPLFVVGGIIITFVLMGIFSSILGGMITTRLHYLEKITVVMVVVFGLLLILDINLAKNITFFNRFHLKGKRKAGNIWAMIMGMSLGLVWIPCVGGQLGAGLATVAINGKVGTGIFLLLIYSIGFSATLLITGYATQFFRKQMVKVMKAPIVVRILSGLILIIFGVMIWTRGMLAFQSM